MAAHAPLSIELLSPKTTAAIVGVQLETLAAWRHHGRYGLKYRKVGRLVKYARADVERWLADRAGTSTSELAAALA